MNSGDTLAESEKQKAAIHAFFDGMLAMQAGSDPFNLCSEVLEAAVLFSNRKTHAIITMGILTKLMFDTSARLQPKCVVPD